MPRCPVWNEGPFQRGADRQVKVGIVKDQNRVLAAHFRLHLLYRLAGHTGRRDPPRVRKSASPTLRPGPVTRFSTTGGSPARIGILTSALALAGKKVGGFEHHAVATGQRRGDGQVQDRGRKVSWRDDAHHAEGLTRALTAAPGRTGEAGFAHQAHRIGGEKGRDLPKRQPTDALQKAGRSSVPAI